MPKYKKQIQEMLAAHRQQFDAFKEIHDKYATDPKIYQQQFNQQGQEILIIIKRWENNLCAKSESSKYGKFSNTLAEKFWNEIRAIFPKIDYVGME